MCQPGSLCAAYNVPPLSVCFFLGGWGGICEARSSSVRSNAAVYERLRGNIGFRERFKSHCGRAKSTDAPTSERGRGTRRMNPWSCPFPAMRVGRAPQSVFRDASVSNSHPSATLSALNNARNGLRMEHKHATGARGCFPGVYDGRTSTATRFRACCRRRSDPVRRSKLEFV